MLSYKNEEQHESEEEKDAGAVSDKDKSDGEGSDESDEKLVPIAISRALSVPVEHGKAMEKIPRRHRKQSSDYSDWIESYRRWRQWQRKDVETQNDLFSPNCSPLQAVVSFAKATQEVSNAEELR